MRAIILSGYISVDTNYQTALHFVTSKNNIDLARKFFELKPPASARVRDKRGQYALHRAAAVGSVPMINLLVKNKSPLNATDVSGHTALHHAVAEGHGEENPNALVACMIADTDHSRGRSGCIVEGGSRDGQEGQ